MWTPELKGFHSNKEARETSVELCLLLISFRESLSQVKLHQVLFQVSKLRGDIMDAHFHAINLVHRKVCLTFLYIFSVVLRFIKIFSIIAAHKIDNIKMSNTQTKYQYLFHAVKVHYSII